MALTLLEENLDIIQGLADLPNSEDGLDPDELKAKFDEAVNIIKHYLNKVLIPQIESDIDAASKGISSGEGIGGEKLVDGSVTGAKLANASISSTKIASKAVTAEKIADKAVSRTQLSEDATTLKTEDFPNKVVPNRALDDAAVTNVKLADGAVTTSKLGNFAVTTSKLADDAKAKGIAIALAPTSWVDSAQTVAVEGVTANNNVIVAAAPESREAYNDAEIYCSAQAEGSLTFVCGSAPETAVTVNVIILV